MQYEEVVKMIEESKHKVDEVLKDDKLQSKVYVMVRRFIEPSWTNPGKAEDVISIMDFDEAVEKNWIDENGNRIWKVPPEKENSPTFVFEFKDLDSATFFYECFLEKELGIKIAEL